MLKQRELALKKREDQILIDDMQMGKLQKNQSENVKKADKILDEKHEMFAEMRLSWKEEIGRSYKREQRLNSFGSLLKKIRITINDIPRSSDVIEDSEACKRHT